MTQITLGMGVEKKPLPKKEKSDWGVNWTFWTSLISMLSRGMLPPLRDPCPPSRFLRDVITFSTSTLTGNNFLIDFYFMDYVTPKSLGEATCICQTFHSTFIAKTMECEASTTVSFIDQEELRIQWIRPMVPLRSYRLINISLTISLRNYRQFHRIA